MAATSSVPDRLTRVPFTVDPFEARRLRRDDRVPDLESEPYALDSDAQAGDPAEARQIRRGQRGRPGRRTVPWLRIGVTSAAVIASLAYVAHLRDRRAGELTAAPVPPANLIAPPPPWQPLPKAAPLYAVEGADGKPLAALLEARRHTGGGREDVLTFGSFGDAGYARLSVTRGPTEPDRGRFFVDLVRRAAAAGLSVARSSQSEAVATKFGSVEAAPITLADNAEQGCLAFRFARDDASFGIQGWLCGSAAMPVSTGQLTCFLDRVVLAGPVDDPPLRALFAESERHRMEACAPAAKPASTRAGPSRF